MHIPVLLPTAVAVGVLWLSFALDASAQVVQNGQVFTNGLAIIDAPQPDTILNAGNYLNIAVDVSGNGKLPLGATAAYSNLPNAFRALEFYLVSSQTNVNITIAVGNSILYQEPSSTVKHYSWPLPQCLPPGAYNLTAYETSVIRGIPRFSITPIPMQVQNSFSTTSCVTMSNAVQPQPQPADEEPQSPWLDPNFVATAISPAVAPTFSMPNIVTVTVGPTGVAWPLTMVPSGMSTTIYIQPSSPTSIPLPSAMTTDLTSTWGTASFNTANGQMGAMGSGGMQVVHTVVTVTSTPTQVTIVFVSVETLTATTTAPGETVVVTTTAASTITSMTAFVGDDVSGNSQFLPVNYAVSTHFTYSVYSMLGAIFVVALGLLL